MTTLGEEHIRREHEELARRSRQLEREQKHLTVYKRTRATAVCSHCHYERPYTEGDEDRPCPACQGGKPQFWQTQPYTR